ncbi:FtsW/RodA/SpoVE family cell cycle protein, partial [Klebsiella pneumoniae]|nr:FtsW/RodA/SpoVE family cell cycle protein [Klebsiella pneumoniae]
INTILGLLMVYSASDQDVGMLVRQGLSFVVGFILLFLCAQVPPKVYQAISPWFYGIAILLLILVLLVGDVRLGAKRWLTLPGI